MKKTKRKAFNFLRSYFDVFNKLKTNEDRLEFLTAIINKQFLDEDPKGLGFIADLGYESQRHAIEQSVKGWKRASNATTMTDPVTTPLSNPPTLPLIHLEEEEEQEEEQEEEVGNKPTKVDGIDFDSLIIFFNKTFGKNSKVISVKIKKAYKERIKEGYSKPFISLAMINASKDQFHIDSNFKHCTLEFFSRADKIDKFGSQGEVKEARIINPQFG